MSNRAVKTVTTRQTVKDLIIRQLLRNTETIGMQVGGSFSQKLRMRFVIRGLIMRHGIPAFRITTYGPLGPPDPLVLTLTRAV